MVPLTRSASLDVIRGVAILQVLIWHQSAYLALGNPHLKTALSLTWSGVDLFFVLSGFLIGRALMQKRGTPNYYAAFYGRRALRILPLYLVLIGLFYVVHGWREPWLALATFTQNIYWAAENRFGVPFLGVTWSLAVEEQFYLVLPLLLALTPQRYVLRVACGLIFAAVGFRTGLVLTGANLTKTYLLLPARMDALFAGVAVAALTHDTATLTDTARQRLVIVLLALAAGMVVMTALALNPVGSVWLATGGYTWVALFYAAVLLLVTASRGRAMPLWLHPLRWMGLAAYSLYLFHLPLTQWLGAHGLFSLPAYGAALAVIGAACWVLIERPCIALGHKVFAYEGARGAGEDLRRTVRATESL